MRLTVHVQAYANCVEDGRYPTADVAFSAINLRNSMPGLGRLLSFAAGSSAHDNWHQAVVGRSKDALGKSRLCSQQRPMG